MKLRYIFSILALVLAVSAQAQIGKGGVYDFGITTPDTLTNADTVLYTVTRELQDDYDFVWQLQAENISGTTAVTATLEERLIPGGQWVTRDTVTFDATGAQFSSGVNLGLEQRWNIITSGTGVTEVKARVWYRRRNN